MTPIEYPALYNDQRGGEPTRIANDGKVLRMILRGVEFAGSWFDDFEPTGLVPAESGFRFNHGDLTACVIECAIPLPVVAEAGALESVIHVRLDLVDREVYCGTDEPALTLRLSVGGASIGAEARGQTFEQALLIIQASLPEGSFLKCCFLCQYSDYNPFGQGMFGCMACYRGNKEAYIKVKDKDDLFEILGTETEMVQETHLCPEFARRTPGTGYRG